MHSCLYFTLKTPYPMPSLSSLINWYLVFMQRSRGHPRHNVAAASTAPAALKAVLFVNLTSTGYIHSIYFAQPINHMN